MDENTMIIRQIMAKKMEEWERMKSSNRQEVRGRSFENFRKLVEEEVDMANKIHSKKMLKELMEQKLEYFDRLASETHALLRSHAESKFKEIGEKEMALAKSVGPSRVRKEAEAETRLAEERRQKEKDDEAKKKSKEKMTQEQFYGYPPWMRVMDYPRMLGVIPGVTKSQGFASAPEIDKKLRLLAQLEAARCVLQNHPIESSASMAREIRKRLKKLNRLQMQVIDDVLGYNPDLMSEIVSELMPTQFERNRFYSFGSDSSSLTKARREREAFGRERLVCPIHDYNIGIYYCPPQELPPHTHYREFNDFYPVNVLHYHEQPPSLHPADAVFDMPPVFPAPTYSVLDLPSYRGHENQPHNFDMTGYAVEDSGVVEQGSSPNDPYCDDQPRVLTPIKEPKLLSQTTVIVNRREPAAETDTAPVPAEQVLVQPVQQAPVVAVPVPAQKTMLGEGTAVPLQPTQVMLASPPVRAQMVTPTEFADETFVRECENNLTRIAESVENMLNSLCTVSFDRPRRRRQQGRHHFDEDYYDEGDDYDDYDESPSLYRKNASKSNLRSGGAAAAGIKTALLFGTGLDKARATSVTWRRPYEQQRRPAHSSGKSDSRAHPEDR
ncbi:hypothetical protein HPB48_001797 [Haemaphysalis longicornis]|uniref:Uncharacterized protein n=1 Tax=Haemaphysalis longicornis TaxID=44386 RepID=A0A9J6G5V6_HAELO|nr:hypothetical protein HPB48_001797 [Haemaphysalis longicornis]